MSPRLTSGDRRRFADRAPRGWLWKAMAVLGLGAAWLYVFVAGDGGWWELRQRRARLHALQEEVAHLEAQNDSLRTVLERMETDPAFLEKVAREELGMVRPGEYLYRVRRADAAGADSGSAPE